ncbi:unnamed protein product [Effrenium voratum]|nr:unnamed protein product [Effrenium voratum]
MFAFGNSAVAGPVARALSFVGRTEPRFLALFLGEIFVVCQVPSNTEQDVVLTIVFALFIFEWVGLTLTDPTYLFGFFFWMDLLGTVSMMLDITYMFGPDVMEIEEVTEGANQDNVIVVRAARAAKLGARAGRLSRAVKLLKMLPGMSRQEDASKVKPGPQVIRAPVEAGGWL